MTREEELESIARAIVEREQNRLALSCGECGSRSVTGSHKPGCLYVRAMRALDQVTQPAGREER